MITFSCRVSRYGRLAVKIERKAALDGRSLLFFCAFFPFVPVVKVWGRLEFNRHILTSTPAPNAQGMRDSLACMRNEWPLGFQSQRWSSQMWPPGRFPYTRDVPILPGVENPMQSQWVPHYSNQSSSISQTRNRRQEQIENVLFQSDPICTAIHLGSEGTLLGNGGRRAC